MLKSTVKGLFKHSAIYTMGWIGSSAASIILLPVYTRYLTKSDYGILEILAYLNEVLSLIMLAGFNYGLSKFYMDAESDEARKNVISSGVMSIIVIGLAGCILAFQANEMIAGVLLGDRDYSRYIKLDIAILYMEMVYTISATYLLVAKKSKAFVGFNLLRLALGIAANLYCLIVLDMGAYGMLVGQLVSNAIAGCIVAANTLRNNGLRINMAILRRMFVFSLPIVPAWLAAGLMHNADRFLIRYFCSLEEVGLYSLGYKFSFMLNALLLSSFTRIWSGAAMYEIAKKDDAQYQYAKITTYFMAVFVFAQYALSLYSSAIVRVFADQKFYEAHRIIPIVSLGLCFHAFYAFFTVGAYIKSKTWLLNFSYFPAAIINIGLNILLLKRYGYMAAAWVTLATYMIFAATAYLTCRRAYRIPFEWRRLTHLFVVASLLYWIASLIRTASLAQEIARGTVFVAVFIAIMYCSNWLEKSELGILNAKIRGTANWLNRRRGLRIGR